MIQLLSQQESWSLLRHGLWTQPVTRIHAGEKFAYVPPPYKLLFDAESSASTPLELIIDSAGWPWQAEPSAGRYAGSQGSFEPSQMIAGDGRSLLRRADGRFAALKDAVQVALGA